MTLLTKKLKRETGGIFSLRVRDPRPVIIEIEPPDLVSFRLKGMKTRFTAPAAWLMQKTIEAEVDRRIREKKAARKAKRRGI